jgi:hypothetical protein
MKNRFQNAAGDRPRLIGNRITITPFTARINVAGLGTLLDLNAVAEQAANLTGDLGFDSFTVNFRDRIADLVDVIRQLGAEGEQILLDDLELRGPHDLRHTFSTWLEDAGIPARVIDELMGHERSRRGELEGGSRIGVRYRHTTPEMAVRVAAAIQERLVVVVQIAEAVLELDGSGGRVF